MIPLLRLGLALSFGIGVAACTPQIIFMKDPQTGQVVQCGPDAERTAARDCANNYRDRGWVETPHASSHDPGQPEAMRFALTRLSDQRRTASAIWNAVLAA